MIKKSVFDGDAKTIKWLNAAVNAEKNALFNYLNYSHMTRNITGKNMFIRIALDEFQHMTILETELARIQAGKKWQKVKVPASPIEQIKHEKNRKTAPGSDAGNADEIAAISLAMKAEKNAMAFYLTRSNEVKSAEARALLKRLSAMEDAHYRILQAELDSINQSGFWLGFREISFETQ
ncbi:MAG: ferritin family protein [Planctomycetes bacterium]|nr:ferritin family protein [Planctomycetota bacterium]